MENKPIVKDQPVTTIFSIVVKYYHQEEYDLWLKKTKTVLQKQKGFLGLEVIRPTDITAPEYFIVLRFENVIDLEMWMDSNTLAELKKESEKFVVNTHRGEYQYGTEMFFSRPLSHVYYPKPPYWKQVFVGMLTVYPLLLIVSNVLKPIVKDLPQMLSLFLSICVVSPIMVYVLPKVSILFKNWLYPKKDRMLKNSKQTC